MKATQAQRQELYELMDQARKERERTSRIEDLVGNVLMSVLGAFVLFTIFLWATV